MISDAAIEIALRDFDRIVHGARNCNHAAEVAIVRAHSAPELERALRLILPDLRHSISSGDGRFTTSQLEAVERALSKASGRLILEAAAE